MGSTVLSEVVNNIHPWSAMIDARSHHPERTTYEQSHSYWHTSPPSSTAPSNTRRRTPSNDAPSKASSVANRQQPTQPIPVSGSSRPPKSRDAPVQTMNTSSQTPTASQTARSSSSPRSPPLPPSDPPMSSDSPAANAGAASTPDSNSLVSSPQPDDQPEDSPQGAHRIKVRDLQHIQSFALEAVNSSSPSAANSEKSSTPGPQYEISDMPIADIIEMVAGLLTKIITTNDQQHEHLHRQIVPPETGPDGSQTSSVLAFHGKNVPSITILSYLTRIHKYCPATWEVFLSLLVYFDRMAHRVNSGPIQGLRQANKEFLDRSARTSQLSMVEASQEAESRDANSTPAQGASSTAWENENTDDCNLSHLFVVDSFNIHRLVIAGVTCAAKYFSDIFFTNSRYAKVGGLPLVELNHLELQFLVLNDFRLAVPVEELESYATMLVEFYAREVAAQQQPEQTEGIEMVTR